MSFLAKGIINEGVMLFSGINERGYSGFGGVRPGYERRIAE
jgi:hypothetical protein